MVPRASPNSAARARSEGRPREYRPAVIRAARTAAACSLRPSAGGLRAGHAGGLRARVAGPGRPARPQLGMPPHRVRVGAAEIQVPAHLVGGRVHAGQCLFGTDTLVAAGIGVFHSGYFCFRRFSEPAQHHAFATFRLFSWYGDFR